MYRYVRIYIKKALKESPIQTADEFSFLITLMTYESMTKTELITNQVMEKTSGTEIIKRLLKQGLICEFADQDDRRSVRVAITDKGRRVLIATFPGMDAVAKIVIGNLSEPEIRTLYYLLKKLDFYHNDIFQNKRGRSLEELSSE
jgi:DNA-binding MarR family transcriptional regulator